MSTFSDDFDLTTPTGTDRRREGDDRIRELKRAWNERYGLEHDNPAGTGGGLSGRHKFAFGNTASRPTDVVAGSVYFNTETAEVELWNGSSWQSLAVTDIANDLGASSGSLTLTGSYQDIPGCVATVPEDGDYVILLRAPLTWAEGGVIPTNAQFAYKINAGSEILIYQSNFPTHVDIGSAFITGFGLERGLSTSDTIQMRGRNVAGNGVAVLGSSGDAHIYIYRIK